MSYPEIINKVSKELNLPNKVVDKSYKAYWLFIKRHIQSLPLKEVLNEEDFNKLKTNFNIPSLGKFSCTYDRILGIRKKYYITKQIREKND